jgi:hypothetical protein
MSAPKIDSQPHTVNALIKSGGGPGPTKPGNQSGEPNKSRFSPDMVPSPTLVTEGKMRVVSQNFSHHEEFFVAPHQREHAREART